MKMLWKTLLLYATLVMVINIHPSQFHVDNTSAAEDVITLQFQKGMKYEYMHKSSGYVFDIYVTTENVESWGGITILNGDTTTATRFKVDKEDLSLYVTDPLKANKLSDEEILGYKINSNSSLSPITMPLTFIYHNQLYNFSLNDLLKGNTITTSWLTYYGEKTTELTVEGPTEYNNYNVYKITVEKTNEIIYISTLEPYLLIDHYYSDSSKLIEFISIEQKSFDVNEYTITDPPFNKHPNVEFNYSIDGLTVDFDASSSYDPDGKISSYEWNFGDGINGTEIHQTHEYTVNGSYIVKLTVNDDEGKNKSISQTIILESSSNGQNGNTSITENRDKSTPSFRFILVICGILIVIFYKKKR